MVEVDGLQYNITRYNTVEVAKNKNVKGDIIIPGSVTIDGKKYKVTCIGEDAFFNQNGLTSVVISNGITYIGRNAFAWCRNLISVEFPESLTSIDVFAFESCRALVSVVLPKSLEGIGHCAFQKCTNLVSITLPKSLRFIEQSVFAECSSLVSIDIPHGIKTIRSDTFHDCTSLNSVTIPNTVESIDYCAFYGCARLSSLKLPESLEKIGDQAFAYCSSLTSINIPSKINSISSAFNFCNSICEFTVHSKNRSYRAVDGVLFSKDMSRMISYPPANKRTHYVVPKKVKSVESNAFTFCNNLKSLVFQEGFETIEKHAFHQCQSLISVDLPKSLITFDEYKFFMCINIKEIKVHKKNLSFHSIDGVLFDKKAETLIYYPPGKPNEHYEIPEGTIRVGHNAFLDCLLTSVSFPISLRCVGDNAFNGCDYLRSLMFPYETNIQKIDRQAFHQCKELKNIYFLGDEEPIMEDSSFYKGPKGRVLHTSHEGFNVLLWHADEIKVDL